MADPEFTIWEIGNLNSLTWMMLSGNGISGSLPSTIGNLKSLKFLYFNDNRLTGVIPSEIGDCTNLEILMVNSNANIGGQSPTNYAKNNEFTKILF